MKPAKRSIVSAILLCAWSAPMAIAAEVFTWTDGDGVTHFSQSAPDNVDQVTKLIINAANSPGYDPLQDPYSVSNQASRINDTWRTLEEKREERRQQRLAERAREPRPAPPAYIAYQRYPQPFNAGFHRPVHAPWQTHNRLQPPGLVDRVQNRQTRATQRNRYDPFRSAQISAPKSRRHSRPIPNR